MRALLVHGEVLGLRVHAGQGGLDRVVRDVEVQRPGLVLEKTVLAHRDAVHVLGRTENEYLLKEGEHAQRLLVRKLLEAEVPCICLCRDYEPTPVMCAMADEGGMPILGTTQLTGAFMRALHDVLQRELSPRCTVHGVLVQVHSLGVLIVGHSGVGKSETALEIILRGHPLVADDVVQLARIGETVVGSGRAPLGHYMEIRGLGVLHVGDLFGQASTVEQAAVDLVVELVDWEEADLADRTGIEEVHRSYLGLALPCVVVPVRPGRNLATIVEVAVRNQILRARGVHSALRFDGDLKLLLDQRRGG